MTRIEIEVSRGGDVHRCLDDLAKLRIEVFSEWPYLYAGTHEYERRYLRQFAAAASSVLVFRTNAPCRISCPEPRGRRSSRCWGPSCLRHEARSPTDRPLLSAASPTRQPFEQVRGELVWRRCSVQPACEPWTMGFRARTHAPRAKRARSQAARAFHPTRRSPLGWPYLPHRDRMPRDRTPSPTPPVPGWLSPG